ncbi:hypothetical protein SAMD00019534_085920 [Acytostelium subglobosum LB1]|uniref:hypothetical protein n=1 Tax=Acytostelium subglobosum LB1 TaxID=1410327 RepID=UPI000644EC63|nr:hypothetical protein SAMD00019534_085920 [Acytostelium subglobosum LB1]GAM25417.1 hypothetical protein SAMD00019534_085920 [Acytostelium subglobosum LB1]|eukprot:XP_012751403.1 hypothetical protein SAMD00019534_085920 [Acytostelium subglobosum LB1]
MPVGFAGTYIPTAYDGDRHIYLVGGFLIDGETNQRSIIERVDRFNIDTQQFDHVGALAIVTSTEIFFHNNLIYVVGAEGLHTFNVLSRETLEFLKFDTLVPICSCFDGADNIYIMSKDTFTRFTLSTKQSVQLSMGPKPNKNQVIFYDGHRGLIFSFGNRSKSHQYSISDNEWTTHNAEIDRESVIDGGCLVRD